MSGNGDLGWITNYIWGIAFPPLSILPTAFTHKLPPESILGRFLGCPKNPLSEPAALEITHLTAQKRPFLSRRFDILNSLFLSITF